VARRHLRTCHVAARCVTDRERHGWSLAFLNLLQPRRPLTNGEAQTAQSRQGAPHKVSARADGVDVIAFESVAADAAWC